MSLAVSPLAPTGFPEMLGVPGVKIATGNSGGRYRGRDDVLFIQMDEPSAVAGVFTQSQTAAAPVLWCRRALEKGLARSIVVNAGNANAFTGSAGDRLVEATVFAATQMAPDPTPPEQVFIASTGVIGEPLPADMIANALEHIAPKLADSDQPGGWEAAAKAIMTTDTFAKGASTTCTIGGKTVTVSGIAKGSGMIAPNMATMLGFLFTDADIDQAVLQRLLTTANDRSFNCITVDGDTSTSDTVLLTATGRAGNQKLTKLNDRGVSTLRAALYRVMEDLAQQIVRDGEGASKFIEVTVTGARSTKSARQVAMSIANSPLVKTAIAGEDANWGRIVMAAGKAGVPFDQNSLTVAVGGIAIAANGERVADYDEAPVAAHMAGDRIEIEVSLGGGRGKGRVWTCDLTHQYITINADYRS
ncbi:MAG: bifunctional glutamate N-acetyltransferase/amino-acid acetyltransferase ArgJ [Alphaproteobacteria bacterium]|nr:bifunctional glutamate N-acetyltransferase/amino-acid acetyltransferase ArgJ [Alphaproteobacteria bacterium SS10]